VYMAAETQLYFQIVEEINYMFRPFSGWAIDDGPPRKVPKHVVHFFNNLKIQLCYGGHIHT
jgi:hypothetical protein